MPDEIKVGAAPVVPAAVEKPVGEQPPAEAPINFEELLDLEREVLAPGAREEEPLVEVPAVEKPPEVVKPPEKPVEAVKPPEEIKKPEEVKKPELLTPEQVKVQRDAALAQIAGRFTFSEEDQQLLLSEPHRVLGKLAAEVQLSTFEMLMGALQGMLPGQIQAHLRAASLHQEGDNKFFKRWPELADPKHHDAVREVARAYRGAFPNASVEEAVEDIGAMAARKLGLKTPGPAPKEEPNPPSLTKPFKPAGTGAAAPPPASKPGKTDDERMWAELVSD